MDKKDILGMLENADDDIIDKLTELCEPLDESADKRIFSKIKKKCVLSEANSEGFEDVVKGVDVYMKKTLKTAITAAAAVIVLAGGTAGGLALYNSVKYKGSSANTEDTSQYNSENFYGIGFRSYDKGGTYTVSSTNNDQTIYLDYETMKKIPLCAVPNCNHTTSSCLATNAKYPVIIGDCIYFFACTNGMKDSKDGPYFEMNSKLKKASLTNSEIEEVCSFNDAIPRNEETLVTIGNKLYFIAYDPDVKADEYGGTSWGNVGGFDYICSIDLVTKEYRNYGRICYVEDEYPAANHSSHAYITGFHNGTIYIDYIFMKEQADPRKTDSTPEWTYYNFEFDTHNEQCTKSELPAAVFSNDDIYCYLDEKNSKLHIIKNGNDNAIDYSYYTNSAVLLNNKLFVNGGWVDISDMTLHLFENANIFAQAYYNGYYIMSDGNNAYKKISEEELGEQ